MMVGHAETVGAWREVLGLSFYGNFMFSTGPNTDAGGKRDTHCHLDVPMRRCSVSLDGRPMTIDGDVVAEGQRVRRAE